ncbi:hypothetical protein G6F38_011242 [Rhizopus arrhizus]|nr:hypothetical protein G6F38_011242 [Rhizopus arrhizus]
MFARRPNENKDYNNVLDKTKSPETMKQLETRINEFNDTVLPAIREKIKTSQAASRDKFNQTHRILTDIPTGSQVTLKNVNRVAKSDPLYVGNYTVKRKTQGGSYVLVDATGALLPRDVPPSQIKVISQEVSLSNTDQSEEHFVWSCPFKHEIWQTIASRFFVDPARLTYSLIQLPSSSGIEVAPSLLATYLDIIASVLLSLWQFHWKFIFEGHPFWTQEVVARATRQILKIHKENSSRSLNS